MTIEELLDESPGHAREREREAFGAAAGTVAERIVLFGAGSLGRKVLRALRASGREPVAFADSNPAIHGRVIGGLVVHPVAEAARRWGREAAFVVTIFHPLVDRGMAWRLEMLRGLGCRVALPFLPLAWQLDGVLPHYGADKPSDLLEHALSLRRVAGLWSDTQSRDVYREQLAWRLRADFAASSDPSPNQYFPRDLLAPVEHEAFFDGGAFDGDTLRAFPWPLERAWAVEPDPANFTKLQAMQRPGFSFHACALGSQSGSIRFNAAASTASARSEQGAIEVPVTTIDALVGAEAPTYIKLDVEGDELAALQGAATTLHRTEPSVAACLYHRVSDLWDVPLFVSTTLPRHRLYLRMHAADGFELVMYALPQHRSTTLT